MKHLRWLPAIVLALSLVVMVVPVSAAKPVEISAGCAALEETSFTANRTASFGGGEFFAGDVISVAVSGPGSGFEFSVNGQVIREGLGMGAFLMYTIPQSGTYDFSVRVAGGTSETTALVDCTPVSETDNKVTICHRPPGNPENAHTIRVGAPAMVAHLAHGDTIGPCLEQDESGYQNLNAGLAIFIFESEDAVYVWGDCTADECQHILTIDLTLLDPEDEDGEFLFESEVSESLYVIIYYLGTSFLDPDFDVFQINVYSGTGALLDDHVQLFMNAEGEIVGWDIRERNIERTELPPHFYE